MPKPGEAIIKGVTKSTAKWAKQRKAEERHAAAAANRRYRMTSMRVITIKEVAEEVMEDAYLKASAGGTLPANARQIMYAARPEIQRRTGQLLDDKYFTQTLLPNYIQDNPATTAGWDVAYDARGHLIEPHTERTVALGTLEVRDYLFDIERGETDPPKLRAWERYDTVGPENRYGALVFFEKEGFMPLIEQSGIAERYDIAVMSSKGMQSTACRQVADEVCGAYDIPLLVAHDFDKQGMSMLGMFQRDNDRYQYEYDLDVHDLGVRLEDIEAFGLEAEGYKVGSVYAARRNLMLNGASPAAIEFILAGQRVELNMFTSDQFIAWLEARFDEIGIQKVVPTGDVLSDAWRRQVVAAEINRRVADVEEHRDEIAAKHPEPANLAAEVAFQLNSRPALSWDQAVAEIANPEEDES